MFPAKPSSVPSWRFFSHFCYVFCWGVRCNCVISPYPLLATACRTFCCVIYVWRSVSSVFSPGPRPPQTPSAAHSGLAVGFALFTVDGPLCLAPLTCSGLHPVSVCSPVFQQLSEKPCSSENQNIMAHCVGIEFWTEHYLLSEFRGCCSTVFWYPLVPFLFLSMTHIYFLYFVLKIF